MKTIAPKASISHFPPSLPTVPTHPQAAEMDSCQAYRKLALAKHPDRGGDPAEFARVTKAYEVRNQWLGWTDELGKYGKKNKKAVIPDLSAGGSLL